MFESTYVRTRHLAKEARGMFHPKAKKNLNNIQLIELVSSQQNSFFSEKIEKFFKNAELF